MPLFNKPLVFAKPNTDVASWNYDFSQDNYVTTTYTGNFTNPVLSGAKPEAMCLIRHNHSAAPTFGTDYIKSAGYNYVPDVNNYLRLVYNAIENKVVVYNENYDLGFASAVDILKPYTTPYVFKDNVLTPSYIVGDEAETRWLNSLNSGGTSPTVLQTDAYGDVDRTYTVLGTEDFIGFDVQDRNDGFATARTQLTTFLEAKDTVTTTFPYVSATNATATLLSDGDGFTGSYYRLVANATGTLNIRARFGSGTGDSGFQSGNDYEFGFRIKATAITGGYPRANRGSGVYDNVYYASSSAPATLATFSSFTTLDVIHTCEYVANDSGATNSFIEIGWDLGSITTTTSVVFVQLFKQKKIL